MDKVIYQAEERSVILNRMNDDQIKTLFAYKRFLWKSYNLTLQYRKANDWVFDGIETDPFYTRGELYKRNNYLRCDICGYHPIKDRYVLKSLSSGQIIGMGQTCFKDQLKITRKIGQEINDNQNRVDWYCDSIIRLFQQGKKFPTKLYQQALKNPEFREKDNGTFFNRMKSFKQVNLPIHAEDKTRLKGYVLQLEGKTNKKESFEKRENIMDRPNFDKFAENQLDALNTYVKYRLYHELPVFEKTFGNSCWKYEDVIVKRISKIHQDKENCICGEESEYLFSLSNKYNQSTILVSPYHLQQHSIINDSTASAKPFNMISRELHQIMIDSLDGKEFQTKAFDEAFNDGFFQPDDKADMLDCCEVLSNANLPLPKHMLQQITEFNKNKENLSLNGKLLTVINAYQTLASVIQISMPGEKLIQELKIVASNYAANKAGVKLPAVGEDQVKLLKSNDIKEQQIRFRKIELFLFYNGIKKQLSPLNLRMAKAMVDSCVDKETRLLVSEKDIATLQKYLKEYY